MNAIEIIFSIGCICIGVFAFVSGLKTVRKCKNKTVGRIIGISESEGRDKDNIRTMYYSPEFEYEVDGQIFHGTGDTSYENHKRIKIGSDIKVYYNPKNPQEHFTKGGGMLPTILGAVAFVFGVLALYGFLTS